VTGVVIVNGLVSMTGVVIVKGTMHLTNTYFKYSMYDSRTTI